MTLEIWVSLSRYCIERVFRPRKLDRFHPKELLECAFDIVTSTTNSSLPTAEIIYTIYEIIQEFPALQVPVHIPTFWGCLLTTRALHRAQWGGRPQNCSSVCAGCESHFTRVAAESLTGTGFVFVYFVWGEGCCFSAHSSKMQEIKLRFLGCFSSTSIASSEPWVAPSCTPSLNPQPHFSSRVHAP